MRKCIETLSEGARKVFNQLVTENYGFRESSMMLPEDSEDMCDFLELVELLSRDGYEEEDQTLFTRRPQLLLRAFGYIQGGNIAFLTKPRVGSKYVADFAVFNVTQGGSALFLIELEPHNSKLFTKEGLPGNRLSTALRQVADWDMEMKRSYAYLARDLVERATKLPRYPERSKNGSFALMQPDKIKDVWQAYGGDEYESVSYSIVIGRWTQLSEEHKKRLLHLNRKPDRIHIQTYDQIAKLAIIKEIHEWY